MGDGRHRQDPRGHGRYLIAALGILLVVVLVATGVYALYTVITADPEQGSAAAASSAARTPARHASVARQPVPSAPPAKEFLRPPTFALTVTGPRSYVSVALPGGKTLLNETLQRGATVRSHHQELVVTVGDPSAVRIAVNGRTRTSSQEGINTFRVSRPG